MDCCCFGGLCSCSFCRDNDFTATTNAASEIITGNQNWNNLTGFFFFSLSSIISQTLFIFPGLYDVNDFLKSGNSGVFIFIFCAMAFLFLSKSSHVGLQEKTQDCEARVDFRTSCQKQLCCFDSMALRSNVHSFAFGRAF